MACSCLATAPVPCGAPACPGGGGCGVGPGNAPISDATYQASLGVTLQGTVDRARRIQHELGLRPYRIFLVWERRDAQQKFQDVRRIELVPVRLGPVSDVRWELGQGGMHPAGTLELTEISPAQVSADDLRGKIDGADLEGDVAFFYEVVQIPRCAGDAPARRGRYSPISLPGLDATYFQWRIVVQDQEAPRSATGGDQTYVPARGHRQRHGSSLQT